MTQILLVEDDPAIAQTLIYALKKQGWQTLWLSTIGDALARLPSLSTLDAVILDVGLPDGSGLTLCQQIRFGSESIHQHVPIVFLSAKGDETDKLLGLEVGGDDYVTKPFSTKEVIARISAIWRRQGMEQDRKPASAPSSPASGDFIKRLPTGLWQYDAATYTLSLDHQALSLSKTELAIMQTFLAQPRQVFGREQLLAAISDHPEHRLARTIDAHIKTLRQKFAELTDRPIISTHRGLGYSLAADD